MSYGAGWIAEEALAIAIYCALKTDKTDEALLMSVNHGGDSDSTGSITGNITGAMYGVASIPEEWLEQLELRDVINQVAQDLELAPKLTRDIKTRYPGC